MRSSDIDASVLALKTFGNVRHIIVLKPIMKYLHTALPSDIRIQQNAIMALRNPAKKDPIRVRSNIFVCLFLRRRMINWLIFFLFITLRISWNYWTNIS